MRDPTTDHVTLLLPRVLRCAYDVTCGVGLLC